MPGVATSPSSNRKRKLDDENALEIDLSAPEPSSKKALRKAKKKPSDAQVQPAGPAKSDDDDSEQTPAAQPAAKGRRVYGIWIGNLPFFATKDSVRSFLTTHGQFDEQEITRIHLPEGKRRGNVPQNKGFAYVDFTTNDAVQRAIGLSEGMLSGRRVLIKDANNFEGRPDEHTQPDGAKASKAGQNKAASAPSRKIFVGNLAFDVTKEMLEEHFSSCGPMSFVHVATFKDSGKCKGYAWVEFDEIESAEAAVRGFAKVPDDDDDDDDNVVEESDSEESDAEPAGKRHKKNKKPKEKKVWVNRLMGRTLRMEFAEDATTRYNKRFGKDAKPKETQSQPIIEEHVTANTTPQAAPRGKSKKTDESTDKPKRGYNSRYSEDTVHRLSGAIVGHQGKKTTFD